MPQSGDDHDELVAAEAADLAAVARNVHQALADLDQQLVAGRMAERIVDVLEAVEIEQRDRRRTAGAAQEASKLSLQGEAVGKPGELVVVRDALELLFRAYVIGDVFVGARDTAHRAVGIVHGRGGGAHVDHLAVLAQPLEVQVAHDLAAQRALHQPDHLRAGWRRHLPRELADGFLGGVAEDALGGPVPQEDAAVRIGADDRDRRGVDHRRQRLLGLLQVVGGAGGVFLALLERGRHLVERRREQPDLAIGLDARAVAEVAGGQRGRILAELPQRADDPARQHPGDAEGQQERHQSEGQANTQTPHHGGERDVGRQADRDQPRHLLGAGGAGDAFDIVRPADHFADVAGGEVPGDGGGIAEIAADPVRAIDAVRDHDQVLVDDADHAAGRELRGGQGVLETLKPRADGKHGAQPAVGVDDRTRDRDDPFVAGARSNEFADRMVVSCENLLEVVAIARKETSGIG